MPNGFSGTGNFHNNRKSSSSYSTPYASSLFIPTVYKTRQSQSSFALAIFNNGNQQSNRIRNFYTIRR